MEKHIVYTNKNTSLADWKKLFKEECAKIGIDPSLKSDLGILHAWELGYTPISLAEEVHRFKSLPRLKQ